VLCSEVWITGWVCARFVACFGGVGCAPRSMITEFSRGNAETSSLAASSFGATRLPIAVDADGSSQSSNVGVGEAAATAAATSATFTGPRITTTGSGEARFAFAVSSKVGRFEIAGPGAATGFGATGATSEVGRFGVAAIGAASNVGRFGGGAGGAGCDTRRVAGDAATTGVACEVGRVAVSAGGFMPAGADVGRLDVAVRAAVIGVSGFVVPAASAPGSDAARGPMCFGTLVGAMIG